jgi:hypothetical protein
MTHAGMQGLENGNGRGLLVDKLEITIIAMEDEGPRGSRGFLVPSYFLGGSMSVPSRAAGRIVASWKSYRVAFCRL